MVGRGLGVALLALLVAGRTSEPAPKKDFDLVLYGATGCIGHLAAAHLAGQEGLKWAVADRNATRLAALVAELSATGVSPPSTIVASLDAAADVWVRRTRAVITAAGPYSIHNGERVVEACARLGVHYADVSDEFYWQREMIDKYDAVARASGARVVLASGFCALAGDLGSQLTISKLAAGVNAEVHVDAWLERYNGGLSAGVIAGTAAMKNASYPHKWDADPYVLVPDVPEALRTDTTVTGLGAVSWVSGEGPVVQNIFGPYDARLLRRSFVDRGQRVHFRAGAKPSMYSEWTAFLALHPHSWSSLSTCPSPTILEKGSWAMRVHATLTSSAASSELLLSGSGDPGYHFTALGLAETGLCLAGHVAGCLRAATSPATGGGVLTTMAALEADVVQRRLEGIGLLNVAGNAVEAVRSVIV